MEELLNTSAIYMDSVNEVYKDCVRPRIVEGSKSRLYVLVDDKEYLADSNLWKTMDIAADISNSTIVFIYSKLDKRSSLYKSGTVFEFEKMSEEILVKYVAKLVTMSEKQMRSLIQMCDRDYSRILLECDKICQYSNALVLPHGESFEELVRCGLIYEPVGDITFKLTDAYVLRDFLSLIHYLDQAKRKSEPEILVLSVLYGSLRQILLVQGLGSDTSNMTARTGLSAYQAKLANDRKGNYSTQELVDALRLVRSVEIGIKTGKIEPAIALDYVAIKLLPYRNVSAR